MVRGAKFTDQNGIRWRVYPTGAAKGADSPWRADVVTNYRRALYSPSLAAKSREDGIRRARAYARNAAAWLPRRSRPGTSAHKNPSRPRAERIKLAHIRPPRTRHRETVIRLRARANPSTAMRLGAPRWQMLREGGEFNRSVREQTRGRTGVYMIREKGGARPLYIGETHTAAPSERRCTKKKGKGRRREKSCAPKAQPLRWWKTISRHFYRWEWDFDPRDPRYKDPEKRPDEWVYRGNHDLEIALYASPPSKAKTIEGQAVLDFRPLHNRKAPELHELEEAPF